MRLLVKSSKGIKRVVLITGTPCVGKTSVAHLLSSKLDAFFVNLTELALHENLVSGVDEERGSIIIDETHMRHEISDIVKKSNKNAVVDGHYAVHVVPKRLVTHVFVLRRDPVELKGLMEKAGFSGRKLWENLASEILDVCLFDALKVHGMETVCELDVTGKSVEMVVGEILEILGGRKKCRVGIVDWIGKLEKESLLSEFLKI